MNSKIRINIPNDFITSFYSNRYIVFIYAQKISDEAVELNNPSKHTHKREADDKEHEDSLRNLQEALDELNSQDSNGKSKRATEVKLRLNPGAFIRKATNDYYGDFSTYFTYQGSLTTPGTQ